MSNDSHDGNDGAGENIGTEQSPARNTMWKPVLSTREKEQVDYIRLQLVRNGTKGVGIDAVRELFERSPDPAHSREIIHIALSVLASEFTEES